MRIFVDTAEIEEIKKALSYGVLDGVTTNPSLIKKAVESRKKKGQKVDMNSYIKHLLKMCKGKPVSLEVIGTSYKDMLREAKILYKKFNPVAKNVNIKVPVDPAMKAGDDVHFDGIRVIKELSKLKIPVNCTLVFTAEQAWLAAKAGARYVSPFAGRVDDYLRKKAGIKFKKSDYFPLEGLERGDTALEDNGVVSGIDLVAQCTEILEMYGYRTEVIAASLRNTQQVRECALMGADIATIPFGVIEELLTHHKTIEGMNAFVKDVVPEYKAVLK